MTKNPEDLQKFYRRNVNRLYRFFLRKGVSKADAEDLTSDTFLELAEAIRSKKEIDDLRQYMYGIARNLFANSLRKKYVEFNLETEKLDYLEEVDNQDHSSEYMEFVAAYVNKLPRKQRLILNLRLVERYTLSQICDQLGKNMSYVKTTQQRGLDRIRELLAKEEKVYTRK